MQEFIQTEYVNGLVDTVEAFGVEDMADMAESLISITIRIPDQGRPVIPA